MVFWLLHQPNDLSIRNFFRQKFQIDLKPLTEGQPKLTGAFASKAQVVFVYSPTLKASTAN
jgi:hypothetical protein